MQSAHYGAMNANSESEAEQEAAVGQRGVGGKPWTTAAESFRMRKLDDASSYQPLPKIWGSAKPILSRHAEQRLIPQFSRSAEPGLKPKQGSGAEGGRGYSVLPRQSVPARPSPRTALPKPDVVQPAVNDRWLLKEIQHQAAAEQKSKEAVLVNCEATFFKGAAMATSPRSQIKAPAQLQRALSGGGGVPLLQPLPTPLQWALEALRKECEAPQASPVDVLGGFPKTPKVPEPPARLRRFDSVGSSGSSLGEEPVALDILDLSSGETPAELLEMRGSGATSPEEKRCVGRGRGRDAAVVPHRLHRVSSAPRAEGGGEDSAPLEHKGRSVLPFEAALVSQGMLPLELPAPLDPGPRPVFLREVRSDSEGDEMVSDISIILSDPPSLPLPGGRFFSEVKEAQRPVPTSKVADSRGEISSRAWDETGEVAPATAWSALNNMALVKQPLPAAVGVCRGYIVRERGAGVPSCSGQALSSFYHLYTEEGQGRADRCLLMAEGQRRCSHTEFQLATCARGLESQQINEGFLGTVCSNLVGSKYIFWEHGGAEEAALAGVVCYTPTATSLRDDYRKLHVVLPKPAPEQALHSPQGRPKVLPLDWKEQLRSCLTLESKEPYYSKEQKRYEYFYHGRTRAGAAVRESVKNFQLVQKSNPDLVLLMFGKISRDIFIMDYRSPLTAQQAFAICLTSIDSKLCCAV